MSEARKQVFYSQNPRVEHVLHNSSIPIQKGRKWKEEMSHQSQAIWKSSRESTIRFQVPGKIFCGSSFCPLYQQLHHLGSRLRLRKLPLFLWCIYSTCLQQNYFINLFHANKILESGQSSFNSSCPCLNQSKRFRWGNISKILELLLCMSWEFTPLDKRVLHRSFMDNHISIPGFCWDCWLSPWVTYLIPSSRKTLSSQILGLPSRACFPNSEAPNISIFCTLHRYGILISAGDGYFLSDDPFLSHFIVRSKKKQRSTFNALLENLPSWISKFITHTFCFPHNHRTQFSWAFGRNVTVSNNNFLVSFWIYSRSLDFSVRSVIPFSFPVICSLPNSEDHIFW